MADEDCSMKKSEFPYAYNSDYFNRCRQPCVAKLVALNILTSFEHKFVSYIALFMSIFNFFFDICIMATLHFQPLLLLLNYL